MKKRLTKVLVATLLIGSVAGITPAMATNVAPASTPLIETGDGTVTPMADQFQTYYRTLNGVLQYRVWNLTQGYWVNEWTNC